MAVDPTVLPEIVEEDPLKTLHDEIVQQTERHRRMPATAENAMSQIDGTVLSFLKEIVVAVAQTRDAQNAAMDELEERTEAAESAAFRVLDKETTVEPDHAEKLTNLVATVRLLTLVIREGGTQPAEVLKSLQDAENLAAECEAIISEARQEDDDEDEEDDEDEAPGATADA
jgi:hypothetical protein